MGRSGQRGQAGVEVLGVAAALALAALVAWQVIVAAYAWQTAQSAARSAARAGIVRAPAERAALTVMPGGLARRATVTATGGGAVRVAIPVPRVLPGGGGFGMVTGAAGAGP